MVLMASFFTADQSRKPDPFAMWVWLARLDQYLTRLEVFTSSVVTLYNHRHLVKTLVWKPNPLPQKHGACTVHNSFCRNVIKFVHRLITAVGIDDLSFGKIVVKQFEASAACHWPYKQPA